MSNGPRGQGDLARLGRVDPRSTAGRRIQAAFSRKPVRTPIRPTTVQGVVAGFGPDTSPGRVGSVAPEVDLERNIRGAYQELEAEVDRQTETRDQRELEIRQGEIVGAELRGPNAQLFIGLTGFVESLNDSGAFVVGGRRSEGVSVEDLIDPDTKIRVQDFKLGSFEVDTPRTYSGVQLYNAVAADPRAYRDITGNSGFKTGELQSAFGNIARSIEARPEIEAAMETAAQEIEVLNADIDRLQADADVLRESISEVDTKGKQPDPLAPEDQVAVLQDVFQRHVNDNRFDLDERIDRLEEAKKVFVPVFDPTSVPPSERLPGRQAGDASAKAQYERQLPIAARVAPVTPVVDPTSVPPSERGGLGGVPSQPGGQPGGPPGQQDLAGLADIDPESSARERLQEAFSEMDFGGVTTPTLPTTPVQTGPTAAEIRDANQAEVERLLAEQFGGFSFFLQKHNSELQVGLTADGEIVAADDPNAVSVKNVLDVIVEQGITAPTRVLGIIQKTEWWQTTDRNMREYDVLTADMSEPEKTEYLEPVLDVLREEAQFLGMQLDPTVARELAEDIKKMGEENDSEYIRGVLIAESGFVASEAAGSSFAAAIDEIMAMSKRYFAPIDEAGAAKYAQNIYIGTQTVEGVERMFREQAAINYPQLENSLNAGFTPEQYFAPYKYEIERMLDRPNVDLYEEFGDVIQFIPDTGTGESRPMTLGEVRKYVRGLDEWQQSSQAKESARALSFSIGKLFGEVA